MTGAVRGKRGSTAALIIDQAERVIAREGVDGFELKDIAEPLGIKIPSIYAHFPGRQAIVGALAERYVGFLAHQFPEDPKAKPMDVLLNGVRGLIIYFASNPAYVRLKLRDLETPGGLPELSSAAEGPASDNLSSGPLRELFERLQALFDRGVASGDFRPMDVVTFYRVVFGALLISLTWPGQDVFTSRDHSAEISRLFPMMEDLVRRLMQP